ncbi:hypothetical protein L218DRAFT_1021119 [Marasmius fiardii PR-910]|nr:hypothetical protein L218DRAFT_1021119 [Marasmius fiardii PR-910]
MDSFSHHHPYVNSTSQIHIRRTSLVIRSPSTIISDISSPYSGAYEHHHHHHLHAHLIHREDYTYSVNIRRESSSSSTSSSGTRTPSPDLRPLPLENIQNPQNENPVVYTEDASTRLSSKIRRRCFNCRGTETTAWRRSHNVPGKLLCNKCGLAERKPPQTVFPEIVELEKRQARLASLGNSNGNSTHPPPPMSTVPHARSSVLPMHRRCRQSATTAQKRQGMLRRDHGATSPPPISIS